MRGPTLKARFADSRDATVAIEFALALPVLICLLLLGVQIVTYVNACRKVELLASSISEMISQAAPPQGSTTATVAAPDLHFAFDAGLVIFPYLMGDARRQGVAWYQDISVDFASIRFSPVNGATCPPNGDQSSCYIANVVWTSTGTTGNNNRPCYFPQVPMDNTAAPDRSHLPRSIYGPVSVIAIDIVFTFHPSFGASFMPVTRIARSVYVQPRYATLINYDTTNNDGIASKCFGF